MNVHFEIQPADMSVGMMAAGFSAWVTQAGTRWEPKVESVGWCEIADYSPTFEECRFQWWSSEGEVSTPEHHVLVERLLHTYAVEYYKVRE